MAGSFTHLVYHFIFSTKNREPLVSDQIQSRLYEYMGGIVRDDGGILYEIGGMPDHVHMLVRYHQRRALADFMRDVKSSSSRWIHDAFPRLGSFHWQDGYGAFTVSKSMEQTVTSYIRTQADHHRTKTFRDEFVELLEEHGLKWDERYIWE